MIHDDIYGLHVHCDECGVKLGDVDIEDDAILYENGEKNANGDPTHKCGDCDPKWASNPDGLVRHQRPVYPPTQELPRAAGSVDEAVGSESETAA